MALPLPFDALQPMPAGLNATPLTVVEFAAHGISGAYGTATAATRPFDAEVAI